MGDKLGRQGSGASTFNMAEQGSQALRLPRFNLLDGRTGFLSAARMESVK